MIKPKIFYIKHRASQLRRSVISDLFRGSILFLDDQSWICAVRALTLLISTINLERRNSKMAISWRETVLYTFTLQIIQRIWHQTCLTIKYIHLVMSFLILTVFISLYPINENLKKNGPWWKFFIFGWETFNKGF